MQNVYTYFLLIIQTTFIFCAQEHTTQRHRVHTELNNFFLNHKRALLTNSAEFKKTKDKVDAGTVHPTLWVLYHEVLKEIPEIKRQMKIADPYITRAVSSLWEDDGSDEDEEKPLTIETEIAISVDRFKRYIQKELHRFFCLAILEREKKLHPVYTKITDDLRPGYEGCCVTISEDLIDSVEKKIDSFSSYLRTQQEQLKKDTKLYAAAQKRKNPYLQILCAEIAKTRTSKPTGLSPRTESLWLSRALDDTSTASKPPRSPHSPKSPRYSPILSPKKRGEKYDPIKEE